MESNGNTKTISQKHEGRISFRRNLTRPVSVGNACIGGGAPILVQSMCATHTKDIEATVSQIEKLAASGASLVRVAVDNDRDVEALKEIRRLTKANLVVDLQENYILAKEVARFVDKIRYNPGHLHHIEREKSIEEKVSWLVSIAKEHGCAIRIGVNCGSVAPEFLDRYPGEPMRALIQSALYHCDLMERFSFERFVVSLKDSDPYKVIKANTLFAAERPNIAIHLGVTEAGLPPDGIIKSRLAFESLITRGIGDTLRVSLTLPNHRKHVEVEAGYQLLRDIEAGRFISVPEFGQGLNIISCPSCSRVENERFVDLAQRVKEMTAYAKQYKLTIAVMGCRVNGPGETDDADLGVWCGPNTVRLKKKDKELGVFEYDEVLERLKIELDHLISLNDGRAASSTGRAGPS